MQERCRAFWNVFYLIDQVPSYAVKFAGKEDPDYQAFQNTQTKFSNTRTKTLTDKFVYKSQLFID